MPPDYVTISKEVGHALVKVEIHPMSKTSKELRDKAAKALRSSRKMKRGKSRNMMQHIAGSYKELARKDEWLGGEAERSRKRVAKPNRTKTDAKAAEMAGAQIDRLGDQSATHGQRATRKRRLLKGPKEFRDISQGPPQAKELSAWQQVREARCHKDHDLSVGSRIRKFKRRDSHA